MNCASPWVLATLATAAAILVMLLLFFVGLIWLIQKVLNALK